MGWRDYPFWLKSGFDSEKPVHKSLAGWDFLQVYTIEEMREEINDNIWITFCYDGENPLIFGCLQTVKELPDFYNIVCVVPQIPCDDVEDFPFVVVNGYSISCRSWISFGGSIEI
jgi:hypothetical protein